MFDLSDLQAKNRLFDMLEKKTAFYSLKTPFQQNKTAFRDVRNAVLSSKFLRFDFQLLISAPIGRRPAL